MYIQDILRTEQFLRFAGAVCSHEEYVCVDHRVTFGNIKLHLPISLPEPKTVKIFLQNKTVLQRINVYRIQSSANRRTEDLILSGKSFMKIKSKNSLKTHSWNKPDKTGTECEA